MNLVAESTGINERIDKHQTAIEILEAIQTFENLLAFRRECFKDYTEYNFTGLLDKTIHQIDIYNRCIERLEQRLKRLMS